jgi:hypothetical protein
MHDRLLARTLRIGLFPGIRRALVEDYEAVTASGVL